MFDTLTRPVYCYYFPEVRAVIDTVVKHYPHDIFLQSIEPGLDNFHEPIIEKYLNVFRNYMPGLESFPYRYVTSGSSEAIFHSLAHLAKLPQRPPLYLVEGEYEGYSGYGGNLGLSFKTIADGTDWGSLEKGIVYLSNPSSRNGMVHPNTLIEMIGKAGHEIRLDAAYVGMTDHEQFLVDHPAVSMVFTSMSKPYGLYYYRVGFTFSRVEMSTLGVNKWFKNILSLVISDKLLDTIDLVALRQTYQKKQQTIIDSINQQYQSQLKPSQVYLLAHQNGSDIPTKLKKEYSRFHRGGSYYRFGLTAEFLKHE